MKIQKALEEAQKRFGHNVTISEVTDYGGLWKMPSTRRYTHLWNYDMSAISFTGGGQTWEETFSGLQKAIDGHGQPEEELIDVPF